MVEKLTIDFNKPLPIFPLPGCVLLPHTTIPLHIFEDRYRKLTHDALDSHGLVAMALLDDTHANPSANGHPPLRPHVCVGYIIKHDRLESGRYNILLQGVCRARIQEEIPNAPYRKAVLKPIEIQSPMEIDLTEHRQKIESLLNQPLLKELAAISAIHNWLSNEIPTTALIDLAIMTFCSSSEQRYAMLAEPLSDRRAAWLEDNLQETQKTLATAERFRQATQPDGTFNN